MKYILAFLLAFTSCARAESEYIIEGRVEEVTAKGLLLYCPPSDRIGYKRAWESSLLIGYPAKLKVGDIVRCFGFITAGGINEGGPPQFKFSRLKQ